MNPLQHLRQTTEQLYRRMDNTPDRDTASVEQDDLGQYDEQAVKRLDRAIGQANAPESESDDEPQPLTPGNRDGPAQPSTKPGPTGAHTTESPNSAGSVYFDHWINVLDKAGLAPELKSAELMVRMAFKNAPPALCPGAADRAVFEIAGSQHLPHRTVAQWLRLRRALNDKVDPITIDQQHYWSSCLQGAPDSPTDRWRTQLLNAHRAAPENAKLTAQQRATFVQYPQWIYAYLRCEEHKQKLIQAQKAVHRTTQAAQSAVTQPESAHSVPPQFGSATGDRTAGHPEAKPAYGSQHGAHMTLADNLGVALLAPFKLSHQVSAGLLQYTRENLQRYRSQRAGELIAESETALTEFETQTQALREDPAIQPLMQQVRRQAEATHRGDLAALLRSRAYPEPLRTALAEQLRTQSELAQRFDRIYTTFDKVADSWGRCGRAHARLGQRWEPEAEQQRRLYDACQSVLPDGRYREALIQQAEQLVQALKRLTQALRVHRSTDSDRHPQPGSKPSTVAPTAVG